MLDYTAQVALVVGGAAENGVGYATAFALAKRGAKVVIADNDVAALEKAVSAMAGSGLQVEGFACDASKESEVQKLFSQIKAKHQKLDVMVYAAAISDNAKMADLSTDLMQKINEVNVYGVFLCCRYAIHLMKEHNYGRVVNVSSVFAKQGWKDIPLVWSATKSSILGFTKNMAREVAKYGITANSVCPGVMAKEMAGVSGDALAKELRPIPLGRFCEAEDVANAIVFLASKEAAYITGEEIDVNGGYLMD